ncbi:F-box protein [Pyrus ussuriensis x Pyrus communis]|uniref:F-box protein n=1 Tax=Pyrus ussuriensis x Pyrus communis TaxID=2448454 RepID=A0A5N5FT79_9ROSA|nr:F-box protein [Pyrus ussuriensis x Pyrus communis]
MLELRVENAAASAGCFCFGHYACKSIMKLFSGYVMYVKSSFQKQLPCKVSVLVENNRNVLRSHDCGYRIDSRNCPNGATFECSVRELPWR